MQYEVGGGTFVDKIGNTQCHEDALEATAASGENHSDCQRSRRLLGLMDLLDLLANLMHSGYQGDSECSDHKPKLRTGWWVLHGEQVTGKVGNQAKIDGVEKGWAAAGRSKRMHDSSLISSTKSAGFSTSKDNEV